MTRVRVCGFNECMGNNNNCRCLLLELPEELLISIIGLVGVRRTDCLGEAVATVNRNEPVDFTEPVRALRPRLVPVMATCVKFRRIALDAYFTNNQLWAKLVSSSSKFSKGTIFPSVTCAPSWAVRIVKGTFAMHPFLCRNVMYLGFEFWLDTENTAEMFSASIERIIHICPRLRAITVFRECIPDPMVGYLKHKIGNVQRKIRNESDRVLVVYFAGTPYVAGQHPPL